LLELRIHYSTCIYPFASLKMHVCVGDSLIYIEQYARLLYCGQLDYKPTMVLSIMVVRTLQKIEVNIRKLQKE
jgi:hypothetical protein